MGISCFISHLDNFKHTQVLEAGNCSVIADVEERGHDSVGRIINVPEKNCLFVMITSVNFHLKRQAKTRAS